MLATVYSICMILLTGSTLLSCVSIQGGCGTPCATSALEMLIAPALLVLPFLKLLWAENLPVEGLVARCAVTSSVATWVVAIVFLFMEVPWALGL